jgi:hypothetical protein
MLKEMLTVRMTADSALCGPLQEYRQNFTEYGKRTLEPPPEEKAIDGNKAPEWFKSASTRKPS